MRVIIGGSNNFVNKSRRADYVNRTCLESGGAAISDSCVYADDTPAITASINKHEDTWNTCAFMIMING